MARILYSVCGVGLGHASRSSIIIKELKKKNEVKIVSYTEGFDFLKKALPEEKIEKIEWFKYYFSGYKINKLLTFLALIPKFPFVLHYNYSKLSKIIKKFNPRIIISDFDINALLIAKNKKIPCILISNMHTLDYLKPKMNFFEKLEYKLSDERMYKAYKGATYYIITSIFKPKKEGSTDNKFFFYPIIEEQLIKNTNKAKESNFFLVYFNEKSLKVVLPLLQQIKNEKFVIYSEKFEKKMQKNKKFVVYSEKSAEKKQKEEKIPENVEFKQFSKQDWMKDVLSCKGILCHGGLLTISEAVILKKPIYAFATKDWMERFHNAFIVQRQGFGLLEEKPTLEGIKNFIESRKKYKKALKEKNIQAENREMIGKIEELIKKISLKK